VLGSRSGPHSPIVGWTRGGVDPFRLRLLESFATRPL
jgi:hypothetical protein